MAVGLRAPAVSRRRGGRQLPMSAVQASESLRGTVQLIPRNADSAVVQPFPRTRSLPLWLRSLMKMQQGSSILMFLAVSAVMAVYGHTVYSHQLWSQEYRKLEMLQRHERQLTSTNETLKNQLAQQAERSGAAFVPQTLANTIFLEPAPHRSVSGAAAATASPTTHSPTPVGY